MDAAHRFDGQGRHVIDIALDDPLEAVADADHLHAIELRADGGGADDAVDARGGTSADQDGEMLVTVHDLLRRHVE